MNEVIPGSQPIKIFCLVQSTNVHTSVDLFVGLFLNKIEKQLIEFFTSNQRRSII